MSVRNSCVARGTTSSNGQTLYTVPAGYTLLLKNVILQNNASAAQVLSLLVYEPSASLTATFYVSPSLGQYAFSVWDGWTAFNGGDALYLGGTNPVVYWVSGALLPFNPVLT